jgi:hypothetical protein
MTLSHVALLIGLFVAPAVLPWLGHRLRRRTPRMRAVFWGATIGYGLGLLATLAALHVPPVLWIGGDARTALVHGGMLLGAVLGAAIGGMMGGRRSGTHEAGIQPGG